MDQCSIDSLSTQQLRCLRLVGRGKTTPEIAFELGIAEGTVNGYIATGMAKLGAANRRTAGYLVLAQDLEQTPQKLPGQNLRVAAEDVSSPVSASLIHEADIRSNFVIDEAVTGTPEGQADTARPLKTIAQIAAIVVAIAIAILAIKPIAQSARDFANAVQPGRPH